MFDDAARASKANPPFRADGANAHVIWRIEKADDPRRDMQWIGHRSQNSISSSALVGLAVSIPVILPAGLLEGALGRFRMLFRAEALSTAAMSSMRRC